MRAGAGRRQDAGSGLDDGSWGSLVEGVVYSDPYLTVPMAAAILLQVGRRQCPVVRHDWGVVRAEGEEDWTGDMAVEEAEEMAHGVLIGRRRRAWNILLTLIVHDLAI